MAVKKRLVSPEQVGALAFIVGVVVAILVGLFSGTVSGGGVTLLVILGLIVGFMNITGKEVTAFLVAAIALMSIGNANLMVIPFVGDWLQAILENIVVFVAPAAIIVAMKEYYNLAAKK